MGSHLSPTETTCYLTADLFYVEVLLQPGGGVTDVKVAQQGEAPVSSESLLQLLSSKNFDEFSVKLECLSSLYNIPGDNEIKVKLFTSLQFLGKDLHKISHLPRALKESNPKVDVILNGNVGFPTDGKDGFPMTIQFYISPLETLQEISAPGIAEIERFGQAAQVIVGPSETTHILQMASLIPQPPQLDPHGHPVFIPMSEVPFESVPASFLLKLQPPLPMLPSFVDKLNQITDIAVPKADLQWALFPQLLMSNSIEDKGHKDMLDNHFLVVCILLLLNLYSVLVFLVI
ncbi:mediator of RNA polymerase II transcription subunit 1-like [Aplochiton taeniatus]